MENKYVIVPQADIDRLEEARLRLYEMLENTHYQYELPYGISGAMWQITHKKYNRFDDMGRYMTERMEGIE